MDYLGIFDDVAAALEFDDQSVKQVVSNIQELKDKRPEAMQKCLAFFSGCDRNVQGYEGLIAAQPRDRPLLALDFRMTSMCHC